MLTKDADHGHYNWVSYASDLPVRYEVLQSDTRLIIKNKIIKHFQSEVLHRLSEHVTDNRKLNLYASVQTNYKFESYLDYIADFTVKCTLAKLRLNAHNLQIETGPFSKKKIPRDEGFCLYCKSQNNFTIENEIHFVLASPLYSEEHRVFLEEIYRHFLTTASLEDLNMYDWLISEDDCNITSHFRMFCKESFDITATFIAIQSII